MLFILAALIKLRIIFNRIFELKFQNLHTYVPFKSSQGLESSNQLTDSSKLCSKPKVLIV